MFPARMRRTGLLGLAGTLALSPVITPALAQTPTPTPVSTPSASPSPTDTTLPAATPEPVATEAPQESQAPPTATSQEPAAPVTPSASPSSTPVTSTTPRPANTPVASTSPRVSAAVAVPALTIAAPTCTGPCAPAGWAAGYGNYRLTGTTTAPAGSIVDVAVVIDGVRIGTIASATVSAAGIWTTTYPTNRAGSVLFVATVRGTTATAQTAPVTVSAPAIVMSTKAYSADTMKGTPVRGQLTTRMPNQKVRLMVWVYVKSEGISRWSLSQNLTTDATGSFNTRLAFDNGSVRTLTWQVETAYPNIPRSYATVFTERKFALIDFVTSPVTASMVPVTYHAGCPVGPSRLTKISMNRFGFDGRIHPGYIIVRTEHVPKFKNVFTAAFTAHFPMREMKDPSPYRNDDTSMAADNTYGFFCRQVNGNPYAMSPHSYGHSVDINPVENPYRKPNGIWYPANGRTYVNRSVRRPGMLFSDSPMTKSFLANNFKWLSGFDWQHFQVK